MLAALSFRPKHFKRKHDEAGTESVEDRPSNFMSLQMLPLFLFGSVDLFRTNIRTMDQGLLTSQAAGMPLA